MTSLFKLFLLSTFLVYTCAFFKFTTKHTKYTTHIMFSGKVSKAPVKISKISKISKATVKISKVSKAPVKISKISKDPVKEPVEVKKISNGQELLDMISKTNSTLQEIGATLKIVLHDEVSSQNSQNSARGPLKSWGHGPEGNKVETKENFDGFELIKNSNKNFSDVAGCHDLKEEILQCVDILINPQLYKDINVRTPRGILFTGLPGTGKTLMARAIAGELNVNFISCMGTMASKKFVGEGPSIIGNLFETARKNKPCIIYIDEIENLVKSRSGDSSGSSKSSDENVCKFLSEMDGFSDNTGVIVIGSTNRPDIIDDAVKREGRMDSIIEFLPPDLETLKHIVKIHLRGRPLGKDIKEDYILQNVNGFTGAQVEGCLNKAILTALRHKRRFMNTNDFNEAVNTILMGKQNKKHKNNLCDDERTAIHEMGHVLLAHFCKNYRDIIEVRLNDKGSNVGGYARFDIEKTMNLKTDYINEIKVLLGGRAAEKLIYKGIDSSGASSDLDRAKKIAYKMIDLGFTDLTVVPHKSEKYLAEYDDRMLEIIEECSKDVNEILKKNIELLKSLSKELIKSRYLNAAQIAKFIKQK